MLAMQQRVTLVSEVIAGVKVTGCALASALHVTVLCHMLQSCAGSGLLPMQLSCMPSAHTAPLGLAASTSFSL